MKKLDFIKKSLPALFSVIFTLFPVFLSAKSVEAEKAVLVAQYFVEQKFDSKAQKEELSIVYIAKTAEYVVYYVFNVGETGFVIISGDDIARPVLGYSTEGKYNPDDLPLNFMTWMADIYNFISAGIKSGCSNNREIEAEWKAFLNRESAYFSKTKNETAVNPLIKTTWNQNDPYWNQSPFYQGNRCLTGCVATSMAQIMKYYNHPATGKGYSEPYTTETLGIYIPAVNLNANYNFNNMGDAVPTTAAQQENVARLMYHCGVTVKMNYKPTESTAKQHNIAKAVTTHFGYDQSIRYELRTYYTDMQWIDLLKKELNTSRPIFYVGYNESGGGHAFVCDGYDNQNYFHFNWGWSGSHDGFFSVNPMPNQYYPNNNDIYCNFKPDAGGKKVYQINIAYEDPGKDLTATKSVVNTLETFTASARFYNTSPWDFVGTYSIGLFNTLGNLVEVIGNYSVSTTLPAWYWWTNPFTINCKVSASVPAGNYTIRAITKANDANEWVVARGTGINELPLQVKGGNSIVENNQTTFSIIPNPTTGKLKIENGELKIKNVEIFDVFGEKVFEQKENPILLRYYDITAFPAGAYFIRITTDNGAVIRKIIKK